MIIWLSAFNTNFWSKKNHQSNKTEYRRRYSAASRTKIKVFQILEKQKQSSRSIRTLIIIIVLIIIMIMINMLTMIIIIIIITSFDMHKKFNNKKY